MTLPSQIEQLFNICIFNQYFQGLRIWIHLFGESLAVCSPASEQKLEYDIQKQKFERDFFHFFLYSNL